MENSKVKLIKYFSIIGGVIAAFLVIYFAAIYFVFFKPNFSRATKQRTVEGEIEFFDGEENYNKHMADVEWFENQKAPLIEMNSHDGLKLKAFLFEAEKDANGTVLLMHGFHSGPVREFATLAKLFHSMGWNVVMPYQRSHGESEGKWITFGIQERYDCRDWILKINEIYGEDLPMFVGGISMGCGTILMTSGFDLPLNVRGFIADCGFTSPWEICYWTLTKQMGLPRGLSNVMLSTANFYGKLLADYPMDGYSSYQALNKCKRPFLFISGTADNTVPYEMTMSNFLLYKAKDPELADLLLVENCPHAIAYLKAPEQYEEKVRNFIARYGRK